MVGPWLDARCCAVAERVEIGRGSQFGTYSFIGSSAREEDGWETTGRA
jgi:hypothetical protein